MTTDAGSRLGPDAPQLGPFHEKVVREWDENTGARFYYCEECEATGDTATTVAHEQWCRLGAIERLVARGTVPGEPDWNYCPKCGDPLTKGWCEECQAARGEASESRRVGASELDAAFTAGWNAGALERNRAGSLVGMNVPSDKTVRAKIAAQLTVAALDGVRADPDALWLAKAVFHVTEPDGGEHWEFTDDAEHSGELEMRVARLASRLIPQPEAPDVTEGGTSHC